jgi:hypothetical protein
VEQEGLEELMEADLVAVLLPEAVAAVVFAEGKVVVWLEGTVEAMMEPEEATVGEFPQPHGR